MNKLCNARSIASFHARMSEWYRLHGRHHLPWRNTRDAYAIYISEVMLQQTQVETVLSRYYHPFLKRFPTLKALAEADRQDVLKAWEGLGYYQRARNLHETAIRANPQLPKEVEALNALPGIGRNTAHAVAAFAHHTPVPVMEANVKRVLCRIFAMEVADEKQLWASAELLLNKDHPFDYNQAMMDLGSMICTKRNPKCNECPANIVCAGKTNPELYPAPKKTKANPVRKRTILLLQNARDEYFASPRAGRFLHGLYHFPEVERDEKEWQEIDLTQAERLGVFEQVYSHFTLDAEVRLLQYTKPVKKGAEHWFKVEAFKELPLSGAEKKVLKLLASFAFGRE